MKKAPVKSNATSYRPKVIPFLALLAYLTGVYTGATLHGLAAVPSMESVACGDATMTKQHNHPLPTQQHQHQEEPKHQHVPSIGLRPDQLKLPVPIFVMGLMKAGTTSIYGYFKCGLDPQTSRLSHYDCDPPSDDSTEHIRLSCGKRMRTNLKNHRGTFSKIDNFTLYAELDAQEMNGGMTVPQWEFLDPIYKEYPNATWILNWREPEKWLHSIDRWQDLRQRFIDKPFGAELPKGTGALDSDMIQFYHAQAQRIRDFVQSHPSLHLVELPIDSPDAGKLLEDAFGITQDCWGQRNVNQGDAKWSLH
eukprot:Nitzschia sp. Nitz4//scaffold100_size80364//11878//12798//NITZ4_005335-RA/size80364-processed-gene-0.43-mRNA-1//-1//CDS//3329532067//282//frame0